MTAPPDSIMQTGAGLFDEIGGILDDGLIIASADGEIQSANNAAIRFLGERLVGKSLVDVLLQKDINQFLRGKHFRRRGS